MRRAAAGLLAACLLAAGLSGCGGRSSIDVVATFDDVGDLVKNHSVQMADVRIGRVRKIRLTDDFKAEVTLSVSTRVHVPRRSTAYLRTTSLLGEKFIELRPDDTEHPDRGPFLRDGDRITKAGEAPEVEFVAEQAITVLGAVAGDDIATLVDTGAKAFGGRGGELKALIGDLTTISAGLASRTNEIMAIVDHLDRATTTLAAGSTDVAALFDNLARTTTVLAENRDRAVRTLQQLSRLARVQNEILDRYRSDLDRQLKQINDIVGVAATQTGEVGRVINWLDRFVTGLPQAIPEDMTQVYMWLIPAAQDPRSQAGAK